MKDTVDLKVRYTDRKRDTTKRNVQSTRKIQKFYI